MWWGTHRSCVDAHTVVRKHTIDGCDGGSRRERWLLGQAEALEACVELEARQTQHRGGA